MLTEVERKIISIYDQRCHEMVEDDDPPLRSVAHQLFSNLAPGTRLIDVGCGYGRIIPALKELGITPDRYLGIDPSVGQLALARERHPDYAFERINIYEIGERFPEQFDAFYLVCVIMHLPRDRVFEAMRSLRACLKPGAVGYVRVLHGEGGFMNSWGQQVCRYDSCDLYRHMTDAGFDPVFWIDGPSVAGTVKAI